MFIPESLREAVAKRKGNPLFDHHIDTGFFRLKDGQATKLAAASQSARFAERLPEFGWEKLVQIDGVPYWLARTPYRYHSDAPDRGWVWAIYLARSEIKETV